MLIFISTFAKKVEDKDVQKVIATVLKNQNKEFKKVEKLIPLGINNDTTIYVATLKDGGYIIISADYSATPVLGSCSEGIYDPENMPGGLLYLMGTYQNSIKSLRDDNVQPSEETQALWDKYLGKQGNKLKSVSLIKNTEGAIEIESKSPLLNTKWGQKTPSSINDQSQKNGYHRYCPSGCLAGCVAVAMAQILYYWRWDVNPTGSNTFDGQTVNFSQNLFCWNRMNLTAPDNDNSRLIYYAGVSCNTDYCARNNESGSNEVKALTGFKNFWGMSSAGEVKNRGFVYFWYNWKQMIKDELDRNRPVLYGGGEHVWVIDGYSGEKTFNCVWGAFDGFHDGYFELGSFNPNGNNYNASETMIVNLFPSTKVNYNVIGPDVLTNQGATYYIDNIAECMYASWNFSPNIQQYYGSNHWAALKAIGGGLGWIDATYVLDGVIHNAPRKEITCTP